LATILVAATVTSCTTPTQNTGTINSGTQIQQNDTLESLMIAAKQAGNSEQGLRESQLINIAQRLFNIGELSSATNILASINHDTLGDKPYITYVLTASDVFLANQALYKAKTLLSSPRLEAILEQLAIEQQRHLHKNRATLYVRTGEIIASLNEHIALGTLLSSTEDINFNNNTIWQQLSELTHKELETLNTDTTDTVLTGWLELAATSKLSQSSLQSQNAATLNWIATHPNHPASQQLPADLALLQKLIDARPDNIAILLPLQGKLSKAGQAIRDGFLAAYFHNQKTEKNNPAVVFYDTSEENIHTLYDRAVANGAEIIIGPLSKEKVSTLQSKASLTVPILALNYLEKDDLTTPPTDKPFYQFGLSLEDEAIQVADRAWLEGHRQALVLSSNAKWSQRASNAFVNRWTEKGGIIVADSHLDKAENYSSTIGSILDINKSQQRATELKRLFGRGFEFEPRRRSDIDMIFLVARSQEGRQIKPTLNFHYASNIPVYATSQIYSSANSNEKNSDLNNIRLTTLPWVLNNDIPEKTLITENITINPAYERLYALGVDSFLLYPRLEQLYQLNEQQLYGTTGRLSISRDKRVSRKQLWANISRGQLQRLRALTLSNDNTL
jgi:outer membrane PBP1 activator LpoA protein